MKSIDKKEVVIWLMILVIVIVPAKRQPAGISAKPGTWPGMVVNTPPRRLMSGSAANKAWV
jgi:hypothetical protein